MASEGEIDMGGEGNPTPPSPGGREPPGSARPGFGSGGQTRGRSTTTPPAGGGQRQADPGQAGEENHITSW